MWCVVCNASYVTGLLGIFLSLQGSAARSERFLLGPQQPVRSLSGDSRSERAKEELNRAGGHACKLTYLNNWFVFINGKKKLDGLGPVDSKPSPHMLQHYKNYSWHLTLDTWHVTRDMWHVTCHTWWEVNIPSKLQWQKYYIPPE